MKTNDKYRCAIIGCGRIASLFDEHDVFIKPSTHGGIYTTHPKTKLVSACDINNKRLKDFGKKYKCNSLYNDYRDMLDNEDIDILSICTHAQDHSTMCIDGAKSGVKAIFCEKPMATNLKECEDMINICNRYNVKLTIDHTRRWDNYFNYINEIINNKVIGDIKAVTAFSTAGLLNGGTHMFDILRSWFGNVEWVDGKLEYDNSTDPSATGIIKFKDVYVYFNNSYKDYVTFDIGLLGSLGKLESFGMVRSNRNFNLYSTKDSLYDKGTKTLNKNKIPEDNIKKLISKKIDMDLKQSPMMNSLDDILYSLENDCETKCNGNDGKSSLEIALAFHISDRTNSKVYLPLINKNLRVIPRMTSFTDDGKFN